MLSMLILAATAAAPLPDMVAQSLHPVAPGFRCEATRAQTVGKGVPGPVRALRLNELPNADEYKTVYRLDEYGCEKPLIARYDIGSAPAKQR